MSKILITGHRGFVGRHFIKLLNTGEHHILGVDLKGKDCYVRSGLAGEFHIDGQDCRDFFKTATGEWDLVIHLAAIVGGREKIEGDPIAVATDLSIDAEMFQWAVRTKQPRVVYFSSSAAYPIHMQGEYMRTVQRHLKEIDIDLKDIASPDMSYGWSKLSGEMLADYARKEGINVHIFRPFSGYGEDQDLDYPFPSFIERTKKYERGEIDYFEIWGDGTAVRDFIHIDDIVEATMKAVELDIQEPINLGSGVGTSFNELAKMCMDQTSIGGHRANFVHLIEKPVGVMYRVSDNSKMLEFYKPKILLEYGIKRALKA